MTVLFERTIRSGDLEYRILADLDDAAISEERLRLTIEGAVRPMPDGTWAEEAIELIVDLVQSFVEIRVNERTIATIPLTLPVPDDTDFLGNGSDVVADDVILDGALGPSAIETIIHLFPTDPFLGCIVKGAISTTVGQTIRCWRTTPPDEPVSQRLGDIRSCLREHGLRMALTFMYRAGRCTLLGGIG